MKHTRRLVTMIIVLAMILTMAISASAVADGSITITNSLNGETYKIYKVFDLTYSGDKVSYTYTKTGDSDEFYTALVADGSPFTLTATTTANVYNVAIKDGKTVDHIVTFLTANEANLGTPTQANATGANTKIEGLAYGYYYVTSTTGSVVTINSAKKDVEITDKNTVPSIDKKQSATEGSYADTDLHLAIGDKVFYQITITDGNGTNKNITINDTMTDGISLNASSISVKKGGTALTKDTDYTVSVTDNDFVLTLNSTYISSLDKGEVVTVTYTGTVNASAVVNSDTNTNTATMTYSAQTQADTAVKVHTYDFVLKKTDGTNALAGAQFKLYTAATGGTEIILNKDGTGYYVASADGVAIDTGNGTGVNIRGLKPGTYYLEETVTPEGYNPLTARQEVIISENATASVEVTVVNNAGSVLPSTGGIGTTIFYILGGILAVGALIVLVTNKRMRAQ